MEGIWSEIQPHLGQPLILEINAENDPNNNVEEAIGLAPNLEAEQEVSAMVNDWIQNQIKDNTGSIEAGPAQLRIQEFAHLDQPNMMDEGYEEEQMNLNQQPLEMNEALDGILGPDNIQIINNQIVWISHAQNGKLMDKFAGQDNFSDSDIEANDRSNS